MLLSLLIPCLAQAQAAPGEAVRVNVDGAWLRVGPSTSADGVQLLEAGRWLELQERGPDDTIGAETAPWWSVSDPWAADEGARGWVWGGLLDPLPEGLPSLEKTLWDRALVLGAEGPVSVVAVHRDRVGGSLELAWWDRGSQTASGRRTLEGWTRFDGAWLKPTGAPRPWIWLDGESKQGDQGQLLSLAEADELMPVLIEAPGHDSELLLVDLDGDGVQEAVVLVTETSPNGRVARRRYESFSLTERGAALGRGDAEELAGLLDAPDLELTELSVQGDEIRALVHNTGSSSRPTAVLARFADGAPGVHSRRPLPALMPGQTLPISLPLPPGAGTLLVTVLPASIESVLSNNRRSLDRLPARPDPRRSYTPARRPQ